MRFQTVKSPGEKTGRQTLQFYGLNLSENYRDGELSDSRNITTENFPIISQRKKREKVLRPGTPPIEWNDPTQIWEWDGKLIVIDNGTLFYDGVPKCHVSDGEKQFAVVNTKLIVWPDKIMIDLSEESAQTPGKYDIMNAELLSGLGVTFTETTMTAPSIAKIYTGAKTVVCGGGVDTWVPKCWTFGKDKSAVENCWRNGRWDMERLRLIAVRSVYWNYGTNYHQIEVGDIIIPKSANGTNSNSVGNDDFPNYPDNNIGVYGVLTGPGGVYAPDYGWGNEWALSGHGSTHVGYFFDSYQCGAGSKDLTTVFNPGEWIEIYPSGHIEERMKRKIQSVTSEMITVTEPFDEEWIGDTFSDLVIKKSIPDMDFICEKDNRLWGCSNKDKTIYCSALGIPTDFHTFDGNDSDAYSVAIGSEGDFTGIYSFGGGVCCFKPDRLIKILGSYPSEFYMNEYRISGIQIGSNRSTIIINEVLYYKSENGIYAYSGGTPSLISEKLGNKHYANAVTGASGSLLYVCMKDDDGKYAVYVYDLKTGLWEKESTEHIMSFTNIGGKLYTLIEDEEANYIVCYSDDGSETVDWMAEFCPFNESTMRRKAFSKLVFRIDLLPGSVLFVETKEDSGIWKQVYKYQVQKQMTVTVPLRIGRCDRFQVRLHGTGTAYIRGMERVFKAQSEV